MKEPIISNQKFNQPISLNYSPEVQSQTDPTVIDSAKYSNSTTEEM